MDPITVIGLVEGSISLAFQCGSAVKSLKKVAREYKYIKLDVSTMVQNLDVMQYTWDRIGTWFQDYAPTDDDSLTQRFKKFLEAGFIVIDALEDYLRSYDISNMTFVRRSRLVFNKGTFQGHQNRIRDQAQTMGLLLQAVQLPSRQATVDRIQQSKKQFAKSDESAFSIVPSRLSSRLSISTGRSSLSNSTTSLAELAYQRLSFENDLFTARVYKRNYRSGRWQGQRRTESGLDLEVATRASNSEKNSINSSGKIPRHEEIGVDNMATQHTNEWTDTDSEAEIAMFSTKEEMGQVSHGIWVKTDVDVTPIEREDILDPEMAYDDYGDLYVDLVDACGKGDIGSIKRHLATTSFSFFASSESDFLHFCPVYAAVSNGHVEVMEMLVEVSESGQDSHLSHLIEKRIGGREDDRCRPLHVASMKGNLQMVHFLLSKGALPCAKTDFGLQPAHFAAEAGSIEVLSILAVAGANISCTDFEGWKPRDRATDPVVKEYLRNMEDNFGTSYKLGISTSSRDEDLQVSCTESRRLKSEDYPTGIDVDRMGDYLRQMDRIISAPSMLDFFTWFCHDLDGRDLLRLLLDHIDLLEENGQPYRVVTTLLILDTYKDKMGKEEVARRVWKIWGNLPVQKQKELILLAEKQRRSKGKEKEEATDQSTEKAETTDESTESSVEYGRGLGIYF